MMMTARDIQQHIMNSLREHPSTRVSWKLLSEVHNLKPDIAPFEAERAALLVDEKYGPWAREQGYRFDVLIDDVGVSAIRFCHAALDPSTLSA